MPLEIIAIESSLLHPRDMEALAQQTRSWARIVELPSHRSVEGEYRAQMAKARIIVGTPRPQWLLETDLRMVQMPSAGYEHFVGVGLELCGDLALCNGRGVFSVGIAEHCLALMLAMCRQLPIFLRAQTQSRWDRTTAGFVELDGQTLLIVGLGDIGCELAKRAHGLGMRILGLRRNVHGAKPACVERVVSPGELHATLAEADHVVVALPGGSATHHLIDRDALASMKPGAMLYSVGRGTAIDQEALVEALRTERLAGAGLDVFEDEPLGPDSPLWMIPGVIITPHVAGFSPGFRHRFAELVKENLRRYHQGVPLRNRISAEELIGATPLVR